MIGGGIKYYKGYKYVLAETYRIQTPISPLSDIDAEYISLDKSGVLTIRGGYAWDGASGPTFDTKSSMRTSLVHDALYQLIREGFLSVGMKAIADELLFKIGVEDGMYRWRAGLWRWYVRRYASKYVQWESENKVITAP